MFAYNRKHPSEEPKEPNSHSNNNIHDLHDIQSQTSLFPILFTDFGNSNNLPYDICFVKDRLRRRVIAYRSKDERMNAFANALPLKFEIQSIQNVLLSVQYKLH